MGGGRDERVAWATLSVMDTTSSPEASSEAQAREKEKAKLEARYPWPGMRQGMRIKGKQVVPLALLLTSQRDGPHQARTCVPGILIAARRA